MRILNRYRINGSGFLVEDPTGDIVKASDLENLFSSIEDAAIREQLLRTLNSAPDAEADRIRKLIASAMQGESNA